MSSSPAPAEGRRPSTAWLPRHAGALVAVAFFATGLATLGDYGVTWDEPESYRAGVANLRLVAAAVGGRPLPPWPWHELPGYQFAADTVRGALATMANVLFWVPGDAAGFHLTNLLLAALAVAALARLAGREGGALLSPLAATALALQPKVIAHAQNNPKDVVAVLAWTVAVAAIAAAARDGRLGRYAVAGVAIGAAIASHVTAILLLPLAALWAGAAGAGALRRRLFGSALAGGVAGAVALLLWPWLWPAPWSRALFVVHHLEHFEVPMRVLYLGRLYAPADLPWHYGAVSALMATPVPLLLAALLGLVLACATSSPGARPARLAALWLAVLVAAELRAPAHYDGARHLLPALPAVALLAAVGIQAAVATLAPRLRSRRRLIRWAVTAAAAALPLALALELAALHPYEDAFLNAVARMILGPEAEHRVELEYWGGTYREGVRWLLAHSPADALVLVPIGPFGAEPFLRGRRELVPRDGDPRRQKQYLMVITREAWYTPRVRAVVAAQRPLFAIRREGSTLLAIYEVPPLPAVATPR